MRERLTVPELLDGMVSDPRQLADSFREVWGVNRYLGGMRLLQAYLSPWLGKRTLTLLDVAAGTGDVAGALERWARRRGTALRATLVDNHPQVLALARALTEQRPTLTVTAGDARRLPFSDGQFDVAICNLALHHFTEPEAVQVLQEMDRVSRLGWVVLDLERHPLAYASARALAWAVWRNPITQHDGPLSVQRSFSALEAQRLVQAAGVRAGVRRHFPFRLAIACRRG